MRLRNNWAEVDTPPVQITQVPKIPPPGHPGSVLPSSLCATVPALHQGLKLPTVLLGLSSEETVLGL